jgi:hypothetical protein
MTAITRPGTEQVRRATLRDLVRQWAAAVATLARWLRTEIADIAAAGQLGPDAETEMGRWTGARV